MFARAREVQGPVLLFVNSWFFMVRSH